MYKTIIWITGGASAKDAELLSHPDLERLLSVPSAGHMGDFWTSKATYHVLGLDPLVYISV